MSVTEQLNMEAEKKPVNYQQENQFNYSEEAIENKLDHSINKIIEKAGFTKWNIEKKPVCTNGGNYLGLLTEINIKGKTKDGNDEINLFVKSAIPGENNAEMISVPNIYKTELFVYKELAKIFENLQDGALVPEEERYKMVKVYNESNTEIIIMENVSKKGFTTPHRMDVISLKFAELAVQELAKFHVLSFVVKEKYPDIFDKEIKPKKHIFNPDNEQWQEFVSSSIKTTLNNIEENVLERVKKFSDSLVAKFRKYVNDEKTMRWLCHGDYRPNNLLKKMIDGEISEILPVDYQLIYFGNPVEDFLYFIVVSTDRTFRRAHLSHLRDMYHETMTNFFKYFDIDINAVYPKEAFEKDYKDKLGFGLITAIIILHFLFVCDDDLPDFATLDGCTRSFKVNDKYKERLQGIVEDYIEWGVL